MKENSTTAENPERDAYRRNNPLGYPNEGDPRERDRLPLKEIAFLDRSGNKFVEL